MQKELIVSRSCLQMLIPHTSFGRPDLTSIFQANQTHTSKALTHNMQYMYPLEVRDQIHQVKPRVNLTDLHLYHLNLEE